MRLVLPPLTDCTRTWALNKGKRYVLPDPIATSFHYCYRNQILSLSACTFPRPLPLTLAQCSYTCPWVGFFIIFLAKKKLRRKCRLPDKYTREENGCHLAILNHLMPTCIYIHIKILLLCASLCPSPISLLCLFHQPGFFFENYLNSGIFILVIQLMGESYFVTPFFCRTLNIFVIRSISCYSDFV